MPVLDLLTLIGAAAGLVVLAMMAATPLLLDLPLRPRPVIRAGPPGATPAGPAVA